MHTEKNLFDHQLPEATVKKYLGIAVFQLFLKCQTCI